MDTVTEAAERAYTGGREKRPRKGNGGIYDQTVGGRMEGNECAVGEGTADNDAVDPLLSGDHGMDEAYGYDFFKTDGG